MKTIIEFVLAIGFIAFFFGGGRAIVNNYTNLTGENARLQHELALTVGREDSYLRMIHRRDDAIAASKCTKVITNWVAHPDLLPVPFTPATVFNK